MGSIERHKIYPKRIYLGPASLCEAKAFEAVLECACSRQTIEHVHTKRASQMVVTNARLPHRSVLQAGTRTQLPLASSKAHQRFKKIANLCIRQCEISVTALGAHCKQAAVL